MSTKTNGFIDTLKCVEIGNKRKKIMGISKRNKDNLFVDVFLISRYDGLNK